MAMNDRFLQCSHWYFYRTHAGLAPATSLWHNIHTMTLDKETVIERVKQYAEELVSELPVTQVILFGSFVTGHPRGDSDIDVAVVMYDVAAADYLAVLKRLCVLRTPIDPMIEPHLMLEVGNNGGFLQEVRRTGEVIYRAA